MITITRNQIEAQKLQELRRSNLRNEELTSRRDEREHQARMLTLGETSRHNIATESFNLQSLGETARHNQAQEAYNISYLAELGRSNRAREAETQRANLASERNRQVELSIQQGVLDQTRIRDANSYRVAIQNLAMDTFRLEEQHRSNVSNEEIRRRQNDITQEQNLFYRDLNVRQQAEVERANLAREQFNLANLSEVQRSNRARETETHRANVAHEQLGYAQLGETARSNMARELISARGVDEQIRSNLASEAIREEANRIQRSLGYRNLDVSNRQIDVQRNRLQAESNWRERTLQLGYAQLNESQRHALESEFLQGQGNQNTLISSILRSAPTWLPILGGVFGG